MAEHMITGTETSAHIRLEPNTPVTVRFDQDVNKIEIVSHEGNAAIWYTVDGTEPAAMSRTAFVIPAGAIGSDERYIPTSGSTVVKVLADTATFISVYRAE